MTKRIVYQSAEGGVAVLIPAPNCGLTLDQIAAKDVPAGLPYKIVDAADIPADRAARDRWAVDAADLTDGTGADYGAGSPNEVAAWDEDGSPILKEQDK